MKKPIFLKSMRLLTALIALSIFTSHPIMANPGLPRFSPEGGGFSVQFQGQPIESEVPNYSAKEARTYIYSTNTNWYGQTVHFRNLKPEALKQYKTSEMLNQMRDAGIATGDAKIINERNLLLHNHSVKEVFYARNDGGQTRARYMLNMGRMYAVIVTATKEEVRTNKRNLQNDLASDAFLNSFELHRK